MENVEWVQVIVLPDPNGRNMRIPAGTYHWVCHVHGKSFCTFYTANLAFQAYQDHLDRDHKEGV